ncbi:MAG: hypothetical protein LUC97_00685 [Clostridiales bacterium]|nr:hypothetical protein [Clostridiales bacterium]
MTKALEGYVEGLKRRKGSYPEWADELYTTESLDEEFPKADVAASFLPGTASTFHIFTEKRFGLMKTPPYS